MDNENTNRWQKVKSSESAETQPKKKSSKSASHTTSSNVSLEVALQAIPSSSELTLSQQSVDNIVNQVGQMSTTKTTVDNKNPTVKLVKHPNVVLPEYKTAGAAGSDLCANIMYPKWLEPGKIELIDTGLTVAHIPEGYELQVRARSGLALRGVTVLNAPGTIDSDYRGPIGVILANFGKDKFEVTRGMRIAQLVLAKVEKATYVAVSPQEVEETSRGQGGFGSTGVL